VSWWQLHDVRAQAAMEFGWWADTVTSEGGLLCPHDGEPLTVGPPESGALKFCRFDGWQAPRDVIRPERGARMGPGG
jgi:hypothetical protein